MLLDSKSIEISMYWGPNLIVGFFLLSLLPTLSRCTVVLVRVYLLRLGS